ncbi:hypothetical protein C8Q80DRAFT_1273822 [Daedaleopsis nitida]|nr:hypothetical protein C8Q80DRAFT_1273822 [Daedaleopsis nitida]
MFKLKGVWQQKGEDTKTPAASSSSRAPVHLYEEALQTECGYSGGQPYMNWPLWAADLAHSPMFDGSDTSLSGDGAHNASQGPYNVTPTVTSAPFVNHTVNFGPYDDSITFQNILPPTFGRMPPLPIRPVP